MTLLGHSIDSGWVQAGCAVLTLLGAFLVAWWRFSKWLHGIVATQTHLITVFGELKVSVGKLAEAQGKLTKAIIEHNVRLAEREKDQLRTEGKVEQTQQNLMNAVATLQVCNSSLDALWRTLQRLFPDQVPRRASERQG